MTTIIDHPQPTALHSRSFTTSAPEIICIDEQDSVKQQELISSVLGTITIREYSRYLGQSAGKNHHPIYEKDIEFWLRADPNRKPECCPYRLHIDPEAMTVLVQKDQNDNDRLQPSQPIGSPKSEMAPGDITLSKSDDPVSDTLTCPPWNYQSRNVVYPCKALARDEKTIANDKPKKNVRVIVLPIKKHLTVGYVPGLSGKAGERPQIRFGGLYLEKFGFMVGKKVCMQIEPNRITLTADEVES